MRYRVQLADEAERDIEDIYNYLLLREDERAADDVLDQLENICAGLADLPGRGNIPKELVSIGMTDYREVHHKPWRIIYRIMGSDVIVYCVADGRRDMQSLLERRLLR